MEPSPVKNFFMKNLLTQFDNFNQKAINSAFDNSSIKSLECDVCKNNENLRTCGRCKEIQYCSIKCQESSWKTHLHTCKKPSEFYMKEDNKTYQISCYQPFANEPLIERAGKVQPQYVVPHYIKVGSQEQLNNKEYRKYLHDNETSKRTIVFVAQHCTLKGKKDDTYYELVPVPCKPVPKVHNYLDMDSGKLVHMTGNL